MKLPYEQVSIEVDKLYDKKFPATATNREIEEHCQFIATFIEACGWDTESFISEYITRGTKDLNPPTIDPKSN